MNRRIFGFVLIVIAAVIVLYFISGNPRGSFTAIETHEQNENNTGYIDLRITSIDATEALQNEEMNITLGIENTGTKDVEDALLSIDFDDESIPTTQSIDIEAGETVYKIMNHYFDLVGIYEINAVIEHIDEANMSDNSMTKIINVYSAENQSTTTTPTSSTQTGMTTRTVPGQSHTACVLDKCTIIDGAGENECSFDVDCPSDVTVDT